MNLITAQVKIFNFLKLKDKLCLASVSKCYNNTFWYEPVEKALIITTQKKYEKFLTWYQERNPYISHMTFGYDFNYPLTLLPNTLTHLSFDSRLGFYSDTSKFNQPLDNLPSTLTHLTLSYRYNLPLLNLPNGLKYLKFGHEFNSLIELPNSLEELHLGTYYNQVINKLPPFLKVLGVQGNNTFSCRIPDTVKTLNLCRDFPIPPTTTELIINYGVTIFEKDIPSMLTKLVLPPYFDDYIDKFPDTITHLEFGSRYNKPIQNLPKNLRFLKLGYYFNKSISFVPDTVEHLELDNAFNLKPKKYPKNLKYLKFKGKFNKPVDNLPHGLLCLKLSNDFNQPLDNLPSTLTHLKIGRLFRQPIQSLPTSLIYLKFKCRIEKPINLPEGLQILKFLYVPEFITIQFPNIRVLKVRYGMVWTRFIESLPDSIRFLTLGNNFPLPMEKFPKNLYHITLYNYTWSFEFPTISQMKSFPKNIVIMNR